MQPTRPTVPSNDDSIPLPAQADEKSEIIAQLRRVAKKLHTGYVCRAKFVKQSGVSVHKIERLFGSYTRLVEAAGLLAHPFGTGKGPVYSQDDLLAEILRVLRLPDSEPTVAFFDLHSQRSGAVCQKRFGSWTAALQAASAQLDPTQDQALLSRIRAHLAYENRRLRLQRADDPSAPAAPAQPDNSVTPVPRRKFPRGRDDLYGELINFRGLTHAPRNEQGVVLLFGMVCHELGYVIEDVRLGFPDCEAKRQLRPNVWQRIRIEFEYQSRSFRSHGHDTGQCDLIVCWEHNWPTCPVEVLELKTVLPQLI